jgi:TPR repeat protein
MLLAGCYEKGDQVVGQNSAKALEYYEMAADNYLIDAMYKAGMMYLEGRGTAIDRGKAITYLKKAASLSHKAAKELLSEIGEN